MFKKISLPLQLVAVILFVFFVGPFLPESVIRVCYTFSLLFKELLNFILPFIIFSFVLTGILSFKKNAPLILAILMGMIFFSNGLVAIISFLVAKIAVPLATCDLTYASAQGAAVLTPFYTVSIPALASNYMLLSSLVLGIMGTFIRVPFLERCLHQMKSGIEYLVNRFFIPFIPLYVLGFLLEINYRGTFVTLFQHYGTTFVLIIVVQIFYLFWFYLVAAGFSITTAWMYIKNALPSYLTAFSTMSSAATIPVTVTAAKKNIDNPGLAQMAVPIMANVHLLGDSISTPLLALVTLVLFKGCIPGFVAYMIFVFYFCIAMFGVAGIPGGGILVILPTLRSQLGFTSEMESVIMTLYFLLDSFGTAANVMGDGALIIMVNKILKKFRLTE